jgi:hypothetical protein
MNASVFFEIVDCCNVGVVQGGEKTGFALETRQTPPVLREGFGKDLDRDIAAELGVPRPVDLPIPPAPMSSIISYVPSFVPVAKVISFPKGLSHLHPG